MCPHQTIEKVELERKAQNRAETTPDRPQLIGHPERKEISRHTREDARNQEARIDAGLSPRKIRLTR